MTEQEIIERLKANKKMGTIYFFLPEPVKDYLLKHAKESFLIFDHFYKEWRLSDGVDCLGSSLYALPDFKPHWEEFDVVDGYFTSKELEADYPYYNYIQFLNESKKHNAFGGLFYVASKESVWSSFPLFEDELGYTRSVSLKYEDLKILIPTKIRFWRFRE